MSVVALGRVPIGRGKSTDACESEEPDGGDDRMLGKDVNRGRIYDSVFGGGGGGARGGGGRGGGNQLCRDRRAKSDVTCLWRYKSAFEPTM